MNNAVPYPCWEKTPGVTVTVGDSKECFFSSLKCVLFCNLCQLHGRLQFATQKRERHQVTFSLPEEAGLHEIFVTSTPGRYKGDQRKEV